MSVNEIKQALGSWNLKLSEKTPRSILNALTYFGHIAFIPGKVDPTLYGDNLLAEARYVGVYRGRSSRDQFELKGCGLEFWLGDEDNKGDIFQTAHTFTNQTFANTIRDLLPPHGSITEGILNSVAGTYNGVHQWQTPRTAITYVTDTFNAEWRVTTTGKLDAGTVAQLFVTNPTTLISRKMPGKDPSLQGLPGTMGTERDVEDYSTRVVLLAEGDGSSIYTGSADAASVPFKDLHGNQVWLTRMVSESATSADNATARAQLQLNRFSGTRNSVSLSTDAYDVKGDFVVGDYVWVFDPDNEFVDTANQVVYRGEIISPLKIRVVEMSWPIQAGYTVAFRDTNGVWIDLTDYYVPEDGSTTITVGEFTRSLTSAGTEPPNPRVAYDTSIPAAPTLNTPFSTSSYINGQGQNKARIIASWNQPLNVDGSTIQDGDHYEVSYKTSAGTEWTTIFQSFDAVILAVEELSPATSYDFRVRAVDQSKNIGDWSSTFTMVSSEDVTPPSTPAAPTVAGNPIQIQVMHSLGKASGGTFNLEMDLDHLDVFVSTTSGFTPGPTTYVGSIIATSSNLSTNTTVMGNFPIADNTPRFVKVIAVDGSGNQSIASAAATVTALLIDTANIADLAVTNAKIGNVSASKITVGSLTADVTLSARIKTADTGPRVELNSGGIAAYNASGVQTVAIAQVDGSVNIIGQLRSGSTGRRIEINPTSTFLPEIRFYPTSGSNFGFLNAVSSGTDVNVGLNSGQFTANSITSHWRSYMTDQNAWYLHSVRSSDQVRNGPQIKLEETQITLDVQRLGLDSVRQGFLELGINHAWFGLNSSTSGAQAHIYCGNDGRFNFVGRFKDYVSAVTNQAVFTGSVDGAAGAANIGLTYGPTMETQMIPLYSVRDNVNHSSTVTDATAVGFSVTISPAASGTWALYFWSYRI